MNEPQIQIHGVTE